MKIAGKIMIGVGVLVGVGVLAGYGLKKLIDDTDVNLDIHCENCTCDGECGHGCECKCAECAQEEAEAPAENVQDEEVNVHIAEEKHAEEAAEASKADAE